MLESLLKMLGRKPSGEKEASAETEPLQKNGTEEKPEKQEPPRKWKLYSCPFCSSNVLSFLHQAVATGSRWDGQHWAVCCEGCGAKGPFGSTREECVGRWNECALMQERNRLAEHCNRLEEEMDKLKKDDLESLLQSSDRMFKTFEWKMSAAKPAVRRIRPSRIGCGRKRRR